MHRLYITVVLACDIYAEAGGHVLEPNQVLKA